MNLFADNDQRKRLERATKEAGRLPPGQVATLKWPVLHYGSIPRFDPATWDFRVFGLVEKPVRLNWEEFLRLPRTEVVADFHCVTRWSRFDNRWEGIPFRAVLGLVQLKPEVRHVLVHGDQGYTANVPLADLDSENVLLALHHDGVPLPAEHGGPVRLVVPHLYAWKSVKWVRGLEFMGQDRPGFWEQNGYHIYGDPWREQRYDTD